MLILFVAVQQATVAKVEVTPATTEIQVGQSVRLSARALDAQGSPVSGVRINWFTGGGEGSVDSTGLVTGGYTGYVRVTAVASSAGGRPVFGQATVRVMPLPISRIDIAPRPTRLAVGSRITLRGTGYSMQNDLRRDPISFSSSNERVARVTSDGRLTATGPGSATITARGGQATATLVIDVVPTQVSRIDVRARSGSSPLPGNTALTVRTGDVLHFAATGYDGSSRALNDLAVRWSLEGGDGVAQIDEDGNFVAENAGKYTVVATIGTQSAEVPVTVSARAVGRGMEVVGRVPVKLRGAEVWVHPNGQCAYYTTIADRVYAIDVTNPAKPVIVDSMLTDARHVNDVMTTEDGRYGVFSREGASNRKNGIVVFEASNPCHPKPISEYTETVSGGVHSSYVYRGHVYLTDDATGSMRVIDIRDPYQPREVARWQTQQTEAGRYVHDIHVEDGLAYLSYWNDGLIILDVGNGMKGGSPEKPVQVSQLKYDLNALYARVDQMYGLGPRGTHTAWRKGKYVFIADEVYGSRPSTGLQDGNDLTFGRLQVVDISNLEKPRIVAWYEPTDGGVHNIWIEGDSLYMGSYQGGGRVLDISGELKGDLLRQGREMAWIFTADSLGHRPRATFTWGAVVKNGLIYFNDINTGLWITRMEPRPSPVP
jgi:hypothetical protein